MDDIIFLSVDDVIDIHQMQIKRFGGMHGIRDLGLLESAVATPKITFGGEYVHQDYVEMAAAYMFHLIKNHAFIDGNKRTGSVVTMTFFDINNIPVELTEDEMFSYAYEVANSTLSKEELTAKLRKHIILM